LAVSGSGDGSVRVLLNPGCDLPNTQRRLTSLMERLTEGETGALVVARKPTEKEYRHFVQVWVWC
jgi:hypothetical protein